MIISAIVAVAQNNVIGKDNEIPWYLSDDLKFFKRTTLNHHIIMGRKSFESIGRPLPRRTNVIITRQPFYVATSCVITHSIEEALTFAKNNGETEVFIIGGGTVYEQSFPYLDKIYYTEVHASVKGDVFFPKLDKNNWEEIYTEPYYANAKNDFDFTVRIFEKTIIDN